MPFDFTILLMVWLKCAITNYRIRNWILSVCGPPRPHQELMGFEIKPINP